MSAEFKDRLKTAMELRKIKPVELSEKTGLSKARISQYLNGVYTPKSKGTYLIAVALDVSETWLMGFDVSMERTINKNDIADNPKITLSTSEQKLIDNYRALNEEGQDVVLDLVDGFVKNGKYKKCSENELGKKKA